MRTWRNAPKTDTMIRLSYRQHVRGYRIGSGVAEVLASGPTYARVRWQHSRHVDKVDAKNYTFVTISPYPTIHGILDAINQT